MVVVDGREHSDVRLGDIRGIFLRGSGLDVLWPEALTLLVMGVSI